MCKLGYIVLGLALLVGALSFAGYRYSNLTSGTAGKVAPATRSVQSAPTAGAARKTTDDSLSGYQMFELGLNVANVVVGILGIWLTLRGIRAERRADAMALRRER